MSHCSRATITRFVCEIDEGVRYTKLFAVASTWTGASAHVPGAGDSEGLQRPTDLEGEEINDRRIITVNTRTQQLFCFFAVYALGQVTRDHAAATCSVLFSYLFRWCFFEFYCFVHVGLARVILEAILLGENWVTSPSPLSPLDICTV